MARPDSELFGLKHVGRQALTSLGLRAFQLATLLATTLLLARVLGPNQFGAFAYATSWLSLLTGLANVGFVHASVREIAQTLARDEHERARSHLRTAFAVGLAASLLATAVVLLARSSVFAQGAELRSAATWGVALTPALVLLLVSQGLLRGQGLAGQAQLPEQLIWPGLMLLASSGLAAADPSLRTAEHALLLYGGCLLVALAVGLVMHWRALPATLRRGPGKLSMEWVVRAAPFVVVLASITVTAQFDVLVVGAYLDARETGIYAFAARLAALPAVVATVIATPLSPAVAGLFARGERAQLQRLVDWAALAGALGSLVLGACVVLGAPWLSGLVNPTYSAGALAVAILCAGRVIEAALGPGGTVLAMTRHAWPAAGAVALGAGTSIVLSLLLVGPYGIVGVACASALSGALRAIVMWWLVKRFEGLSSSAFEALLNVVTGKSAPPSG